MSYGLIDDRGWYECIFYYGAVLRCPSSRANVGEPHCRVLQRVHDFPLVGGVSDNTQTRVGGLLHMGVKRT